MRLIDADALKQTLCAECVRTQCEDCDIDYHFEHLAPTIDAVPIVRCKDCQWWNNNDGNCSVNEGLWLTTNFCSWGLRREDGDAEIG